MANFGPFTTLGEIRYPTTTENQQGFPCGPADQALFNGLFHRIESELRDTITFAGLTGNDSDLTQLRQAILALIAANTGVPPPDTTGFLLTAQARARLPVFPHVTTNVNGKVGTTSTGSGNVRIPAGVTILHRGIFPIATVLTDLVTVASKTYHLRCDLTTGTFSLKDLADTVGYNPAALVETDPSFDSTFDNMLVARVVTNVSNAVTITDLVNLDDLFWSELKSGAGSALSVNYDSSFTGTVTMNWSRTPKTFVTVGDLATGGSPAFLEYANQIINRSVTRYQASATVHSNWREAYGPPTALVGQIQFDLAA